MWEAFNDVCIVVGGIEASLRRLAHYDWWDNTERRSILLDSRADILVYGMGERQVVEIAKRLAKKSGLVGIRGTAIVINQLLVFSSQLVDKNDSAKDDMLSPWYFEIPAYEEVKHDRDKFNEAFRLTSINQDPFQGRSLVQKHGDRYVIQFPPQSPLTSHELDEIYELPYMKAWRPSYNVRMRYSRL